MLREAAGLLFRSRDTTNGVDGTWESATSCDLRWGYRLFVFTDGTWVVRRAA